MTVSNLTANVTAFEFSITGYIGKVYSFELKETDSGMILNTEEGSFGATEKKNKAVSEDEWNDFFAKIFGELKVMDYADRYEREDLMIDGEYWKILITFRDGSVKESGGNSVYPENWDGLMDALDMIS